MRQIPQSPNGLLATLQNMNNYLVPVDEKFVEDLAKAIARDRLQRDASTTVEHMIGKNPTITKNIESVFDRVFDKLWEGTSDADNLQKEGYRADARAAINRINLKLLTHQS